jgi:putative copper resistance protein D
MRRAPLPLAALALLWLLVTAGPAAAQSLDPGPAFSEVNHRVAGVFLLALAGLIVWESRGPRPFPWSALSAPLWIVLGTLLFVRSDPEAWPYGPGSVAEIVGDPLVLQHKILTLIPVAIGLVEGLQKSGRLRQVEWRYLFPGLGLFGGASLFLHFHDGGLHLSGIYLQHAVMGVTSLGVGATLLFARRGEQAGVALDRAWPALIAVLGVVLLCYSEG